MLRVRSLEDFLELVNKHRPVFLSVAELLEHPGTCEITVSGFSKLGDYIAVSAMFNEKCNDKSGEECEELVFNKVKQYLLNHFSKVYEGVITE